MLQNMSVSGAYALLAFVIFQSFTSLILVILLIRKRKDFPIQGRRLVPLVTSIFSVSLNMLLPMIFIFTTTDCLWVRFMNGVCFAGVVDVYFVRFFSLWYSYKLTNEQLNYLPELYKTRRSRISIINRVNTNEPRDDAPNISTTFMRYKKLNEKGPVNLLMAVILFIRIGWAYSYGLATPMSEASLEYPVCDYNHTANVAGSIWFAVYNLVIFSWAYSMRKFNDALNIRVEMTRFAFWLLFAGSAILLVQETLESYTQLTVIFLLTSVLPIISGLVPLLNARKHSEHVANFDPTQHKSLEQQLSTPGGYDAFREYLGQEFSVENLLFYEAVETYRRKYGTRTEKGNAKAAALLCLYFITARAPLQINISATKRLEIFERLQIIDVIGIVDGGTSLFGEILNSPDDILDTMNMQSARADIGVFDDAQNAAYDLMEGDSYVRYRLQYLKSKTQPV